MGLQPRHLSGIGRWIHATGADMAPMIRKRGFSPRGGSHGPGVYAGSRPELVEPWIWRRRYGDVEAEALMGYVEPKDLVDLGDYIRLTSDSPTSLRQLYNRQRLGVMEALRGGKSAVMRNHPTWGDFYVLDPKFATRSLREFEADPSNFYSVFDGYKEGLERYLKNNPHLRTPADPVNSDSPSLLEYLNRL